jgi:hypothetical protein
MSNRVIFSGVLLFTAASVTQVLSAQGPLVCSGTFEGTQTISLAFAPGAKPAPTLGATCAKKGTTTPVGQVVKGTATVPLFLTSAVVVGAASTAGGANTSGAGHAGATLVCSGTRVNGTAFTFSFAANTSPAPTLGVACVPSGKKMPKGKAVMGTAPKASQVFAVVFVPASTGGGTPNANQQPNSSPPAATPTGTTPAMIATGIFNLQTAISNLQTAGSAWGPHLTNALNYINQALNACGVTPPPPPSGGSNTGSTANTTLMTLGIQRVTKAQTEFKNAKDPWGGRRDKALPFITQALQELQAAKKLAPGLNTVSNTPNANPPGPPMIADGIANLRNARSNLEMAGPNWGPHLANAINYIDQALDVCGVTTPDSGMANSVTTDLPSMMTTGTGQVTKAQTDFKNAKDPWGGRRDKTLPFITQALQELQLAAAAPTGP